MNQKPSKEFVYRRLRAELGEIEEPSVLDLGCGRAAFGERLVQDRVTLSYTGVEPSPIDAEQARRGLAPHAARARVLNELVPPRDGRVLAGHDAVISLSVLEHVKHLDRFLAYSAACAAPGGRVVHLYDLGHALTPSSWRERAHVAAARVPVARMAIPATRWTSYVSLDAVVASMRRAGLAIDEVTHHNAPDAVALLKLAPDDEDGQRLLDEVVAWEGALGPALAAVDPAVREPLLPSVAVWARRPAGGSGDA